MRIIEGKGPPSQDTFGNSSYLYKDVDTGKFYRCYGYGNVNEDRTLPFEKFSRICPPENF